MSEGSETRHYYLTRSVPLHDYSFFLEKPTMILMRNGAIIWTNAEFVCKMYGVHLIWPELDVPVGKCWFVEMEGMSDGSICVVRVIDKDVEVEREVR